MRLATAHIVGEVSNNDQQTTLRVTLEISARNLVLHVHAYLACYAVLDAFVRVKMSLAIDNVNIRRGPSVANDGKKGKH